LLVDLLQLTAVAGSADADPGVERPDLLQFQGRLGGEEGVGSQLEHVQ